MTTVLPRFFQENNTLKRLSRENAYGVAFCLDMEFTRYSAVATSHVLVFVLKGEKIIHRKSGDLVVEEGSCVFIPKGTYLLSDVRSNEGVFKRMVLFFDDTFLQEFLAGISGEYPQTTGEEITVFPLSPLIEGIIDTLPPYLEKDLHYGEKLTKMKLHEILINMLENDPSGNFYASLNRVCSSGPKDLRLFMTVHVNQPLTVEEFAHLSCRSTRQFNRDFKELFGENPRSWIRRKRLEYAHNQLSISKRTVSEIAEEAGFQNYSNFIQLFKQQFDITPKQLQLNSSL